LKIIGEMGNHTCYRFSLLTFTIVQQCALIFPHKPLTASNQLDAKCPLHDTAIVCFVSCLL